MICPTCHAQTMVEHIASDCLRIVQRRHDATVEVNRKLRMDNWERMRRCERLALRTATAEAEVRRLRHELDRVTRKARKTLARVREIAA